MDKGSEENMSNIQGTPTERNYLDLAAAIVDVACKDYRAELRKLLKNKASGDLDKRYNILTQIKILHKDFHGDWFYELGVIDADFFLRKLREQVAEERKKEVNKARKRQQGSW